MVYFADKIFSGFSLTNLACLVSFYSVPKLTGLNYISGNSLHIQYRYYYLIFLHIDLFSFLFFLWYWEIRLIKLSGKVQASSTQSMNHLSHSWAVSLVIFSRHFLTHSSETYFANLLSSHLLVDFMLLPFARVSLILFMVNLWITFTFVLFCQFCCYLF